MPPASLKPPAAITLSVDSVIRAAGWLLVPMSRGDQSLPFQRAILVAVNGRPGDAPPATRSPFVKVARAVTGPTAPNGMPFDSADQVVPFHLAMLLAVTLPVIAKPPPAASSPLGSTAKASTYPLSPCSENPDPSGDHEEPFQRAMPFDNTPPAVAKIPPATRSPLGNTERASTVPFIPDPSGAHEEPSHRAIPFDIEPPAVLKEPLATISPLGSVVRASTAPSIMSHAILDQVVPFHRAMRLAVTPPAVVKPPPAMRSPLGRDARARTLLSTPVPIADQLSPSHRATLWAGSPPAVLNLPPAIRSPLDSVAKART